MEGYRTVAAAAMAELCEKRSRFIAVLQPVKTEAEAAEKIAALRKQHFDARHTVFAFCLREGGVRRCSDDGEPQGTGGAPVLQVLDGAGLTDCLLTVTRYFGGILLGTGGLTRAYGGAAKAALSAAAIMEMRPFAGLTVDCDYRQYGFVGPLFSRLGGRVEDTAFAEGVTVSGVVPEDAVGAFSRALTEASAGTLTAVVGDTAFVPVLAENG